MRNMLKYEHSDNRVVVDFVEDILKGKSEFVHHYQNLHSGSHA
jgi:hypothetical protein